MEQFFVLVSVSEEGDKAQHELVTAAFHSFIHSFIHSFTRSFIRF